jgi:hypothetical protein
VDIKGRRVQQGQAPQSVATNGHPATFRVSSFDDDPTVRGAIEERVEAADFTRDASGKPVGLEGPHARVIEEAVINGVDYVPVDPEKPDGETRREESPDALNPFSLPKPDAQGHFVFTDEPTHPALLIERNAQGQVIRDAQGLAKWIPTDRHQAQTTAFEAVNAVADAYKDWTGREVRWGIDGQLSIETHAFIEANANYSPSDLGLHFGVVPYRETPGAELKMFETASSWETVAHEAGHAAHNALKPFRLSADGILGFGQWGESFGDQIQMWTSLRDPDRVAAVLKETGGDLSKLSDLTRMSEGLAMAIATFPGLDETMRQDLLRMGALRLSMNDKTVQNTSDQVHDRSEVLTGAVYGGFQSLYQQLRDSGLSPEQALTQAGDELGGLMLEVAAYCAENVMSLSDIALAYLAADAEHHGGKLRGALEAEFLRRGLLTPEAIATWETKRKALPTLTLPADLSRDAMQAWLNQHQKAFGAEAPASLQLHRAEPDANGYTQVMMQLVIGEGADRFVLGNAGNAIFRPDGSLASLHPANPEGLSATEALDFLKGLREREELGPDDRVTFAINPANNEMTGYIEKDGGRSPLLNVVSMKHPERVETQAAFHDHGLLGGVTPAELDAMMAA